MRSKGSTGGSKNVAIRMDPHRYRELRLAVVQRGTTLQSAILEAIENWLSQNAEEDEATRRLRVERAMGMFAARNRERILSEELLAERRLEAQRE